MPIYHSLERYATHCSNTTSFFSHFIDIVSGEMTAYYMVIWHKSDLNHMRSICLLLLKYWKLYLAFGSNTFNSHYHSCTTVQMSTLTESCCVTMSRWPHILLYCRLSLNFQFLTSHTAAAISEHENIVINIFFKLLRVPWSNRRQRTLLCFNIQWTFTVGYTYIIAS